MPARSAISLTLPPAKILPAPVRMTARIEASALAASTARSNAAMKSSPVIALPTSGWVIVQTCVGPWAAISRGGSCG